MIPLYLIATVLLALMLRSVSDDWGVIWQYSIGLMVVCFMGVTVLVWCYIKLTKLFAKDYLQYCTCCGV